MSPMDGRLEDQMNSLWLSGQRLKVLEAEAERRGTSLLQRLHTDLPGW